MTKTLEEALARVREWPERRQEDAARLLLAMDAQNAQRAPLTPEQIERVTASKALADAGEFATDDDVAAFFAKHGA
jgi:hypothetical protein